MRWRALLFVSLGANVVLAAGWIASARHRHVPATTIAPPVQIQQTIKTNVVLRRQFFTWSEVESADYPTYIANLRAIGCPEQTIRDIIIAEVNSLYARRLATELPEQQWWRSEPDADVARLVAAKVRELEEERRGLLTRLLGTAWEAGDMVSLPRPSRPGVVLDGPVLGFLPAEVKQAIEDLSARSRERMEAYVAAQREQGKAIDAADVARLRQQTRDELARLLTPGQLEEYLLRYSQNANNLRSELGQLKYFNATPDEFRSIFRATDSLNQRLAMLDGSIDPNSTAQREALERQRDEAIRLALGPARYKLYMMLHDPVYQQAFASAQQAGTPEAADTIYQINLATAEEEASIRANTNLTVQQREIAIKETELRQLQANTIVSGQEVLPEEPPAPAAEEPPSKPAMRTHAYVLGVGETVANVANRYGVTMEDLRAANPTVNFRRLRAGDVVQVPDALQSQ